MMRGGVKRTGLRIDVWGALLLSLFMAGSAPEAPVADAAQRGDVETVRALLRRGADVNAAQGDGMRALHWAATMGRADIIDVLLYAGADPESTTRLGAYTALHLASKAGHAEAIERLMQGHARPETETSTGATALHFAARSGRADAVATLIRHGAEVDSRAGSAEQTPLIWATASDRVAAMTILLEAGADVSLTSSVVDYVAISAQDRPARLLRQRLVTAQRLAAEGPQEPEEDEESPAAEQPSTPEAEEEDESPEAEDEGGTPEEAEAEQEDAESDEAEQEDAEPDEQEDAEGEEGAGEADEGGEEGGEEGEEDPREEDEPADEEGEATEEEEEEAERALSYTQLVGLEGGFTALHYASRDGYVQAAYLLLDYGADINQGTGGDATSPLLMATINGNFDLAMSFLGMGADPNHVAEDGAAPLFTVLNRRWGPKAAYPQPSAFRQQETDYLDLMTALLEAGADVNHRTARHIWYTSFNFDQLGVKFAGATAFWRAAYATDVPAMRLLIAAGADPEIPTLKVPSRRFSFRPTGGSKEDQSGLDPVPVGGPAVWPIHAASGVGYGEGFAANSHSHAPESWLAAVEYLVGELGADVNARDLNGYSPVHHAAARGDDELIMYFVEQGADVSFLSRRGETTVDMANGPRQRVQPFPETIALLEGLGVKNNHNCQSC